MPQLNGFQCHKWLKNSICPIDGTLKGTTSLGQSGPGSNGNEGVHNIPQSSRIRASPSDSLVSYPGHSLEGSYPSIKMQSVYSTALSNSAGLIWITFYMK